MCHVEPLQPVRIIPILLVRLHELLHFPQLEMGRAGISTQICLVSAPPPAALPVYREAHTVLRTLKHPPPRFPGGPASVTCCLLSIPPANNHSSIGFIIFVAHSYCSSKFILSGTVLLGFPGGTVVKNLPANARDTGLISGL